MLHNNLKLLSNSSLDLLHKCPRKYQLYKLMPATYKGEEADDDEHTSFGTLLGNGIQSYLQFGDVSTAYFDMFKNYKGDVTDIEFGGKSKKTFVHALGGVDAFAAFKQIELSGYDLLYINGKPAVELGFTLHLLDGFVYRGFIDAILVHKAKNKLTVYENKTTGFNNIHEAMFKNSGQGIGYDLVVDAVSKKLGMDNGFSFEVNYGIYKTRVMEWERFRFQKSHVDRARWLKSILLDSEQIARFAEEDYFPQNGSSCYDFFRPCQYFDSCGMQDKYLFGDIDKVPLITDKKERYTYEFNLMDLLQVQEDKILAGEEPEPEPWE